MKALLLSVIALALAAPAGAEACTLNYKDLKSAVDVSSKLVRSKSRVRYSRSARSVSQSLVLKDGQDVTYTAGGCEHFTFSFAYSVATYPVNAQDAFSRSLVMVKKTPVTADQAANKDTIVKGLHAGLANLPEENEEGFYYFPCGDASCWVGKSESGQLEVTYSFAL